jgi:peptidoglycan/xylan/chitin deacetylase (PgdA/CDA1 family)
MSCLEEMGIRGVSMAAAVEHRRLRGRWPRDAVALTFDDGYQNLHCHAMPVLAKRGFSATVFLVTGHVGKRNDWAEPPSGLGSQPMLTWSEARDLAESGWEIGAHTRTHPDLRKLPGELVRREIVDSRTDIEDALGRRADSFAYPFGRSTDVAVSVASQEFASACTTELRCASEEEPHRLPRIEMFYIRDRERLRRLVSGRLSSYLTIRRWGRTLRQALPA